MADGIRIQPSAETLKVLNLETVANRPWVVRDITRPLKGYHECAQCGRHEYKTYHLQLDAEGTVMVSTTIWHQLQLLHDSGGFEKVNVVTKPPAQRIEIPTACLKIIPVEM